MITTNFSLLPYFINGTDTFHLNGFPSKWKVLREKRRDLTVKKVEEVIPETGRNTPSKPDPSPSFSHPSSPQSVVQEIKEPLPTS